MAVKSFNLTVTTTRVPITIPIDDAITGCTVWLYNDSNGTPNKISIGGPDVTVANGLHLYAEEKFGPMTLVNGEVIYAISDSGTGLDLHVFVTGV